MTFIVDVLPIVLVVLGAILLLVAYYVHRQTAHLSRTIAQLYQLNQQVNQDALDFFDQAWSILAKAGIVQLKARIEWFGERKTANFGQPKENSHQQSITLQTDDMCFELHFSLPKHRGERSEWLNLIVTTFSQILQQDIEHKHAEILASQKRLERYQLFVQHEVKNIAQFISLLNEQMALLTQDHDKVRLVNRLQTTLPTMAQRAKNTIAQMKQPLHGAAFYDSQPVELHSLIEEVLFMYQLSAQVKGYATLSIAKPVLLEVFKNILGNYRDHPLGDCALQLEITEKFTIPTTPKTQTEPGREATGAVVTIQSCALADAQPLKSERLFEPFWTTSQSGMGLGLFLTRELLKQVGSEVHFEQQGQRLSFTLELNNVPKIS